MKCPNGHDKMQEIKIGNVKIDHCSQCEGMWFEKDELRLAKDSQDEYAEWFDIDLWKNEDSFKSAPSSGTCPVCEIPLHTIDYGDSGIKIDACNKCHGIWLDKNEFSHIIEFIKLKYPYELVYNYVKTLVEEGKEIFTGPESLKSEINDFLIVLKLLQFKIFATPMLMQIILNLPLTK